MLVTRTELINDIVSAEWDFFQRVNNAGGRADCQDMPETFGIMRSSQFDIWTDEMIASYYDDLREAYNQDRNPLAEKYAYMMESTFPEEYVELAGEIPAVSEDKAALVEAIIAIQMPWAEEMAAKYPQYMRRGRPLHTSEDSAAVTSLETYSRGELKTYSTKTLELMLEHFRQARDEGRNLQEESDTEQVRQLGYADLAAAEEAARVSNGFRA